MVKKREARKDADGEVDRGLQVAGRTRGKGEVPGVASKEMVKRNSTRETKILVERSATKVAAERATKAAAEKETKALAEKETKALVKKETKVVVAKRETKSVVAKKETQVLVAREAKMVAKKEAKVAAKKGTNALAKLKSKLAAREVVETRVKASRPRPSMAVVQHIAGREEWNLPLAAQASGYTKGYTLPADDCWAAEGEFLNLRVVGVAYGNRQELWKRVTKGDHLRIVPEADNPYDANALAVMNLDGQNLGYINREVAAELAPLVPPSGRAAACVQKRPPIVSLLNMAALQAANAAEGTDEEAIALEMARQAAGLSAPKRKRIAPPK